MAGAACRPVQGRPRAQTRSPRGRDGANERWQRSQAPARVKCHHAASHGRERYTTETGGSEHRREEFRFGKLPDGFDQILVSVTVAGHGVSNARDHLKGIKLIERIKAWHVDRRKLQTQESPAGLEHAMGLRKCLLDARHVADAEGYGHAIEAAIRISELFGIALLEGDHAIKTALRCALSAHRK